MLRAIHILFLLGKYLIVYYLSVLKIYTTPKQKLLRNFFEEAGGAYIKFGQLLALRVDALPKEYALELIDLFDHVKPFTYALVNRVFLSELGVKPEEVFAIFEKEPFASASFGQVHAAKLTTGETVAVKIQRPGIHEAATVDFIIINFLATLGDLFFKIEALPWKEFAKEFKTWTLAELDYLIEAENAQKIYDNHVNLSGTNIEIPKTYPRLSTKKILVQEYIDGIPLSRVLKEMKRGKLGREKLKEWGIDLNLAPRILIGELLRQYFIDGFFHADPHPGNILLLENGNIGLIDFGITGVAAPKKIALMKLMESGSNDNFKKVGFYLLKFAGDDMERIITSSLPATVDQKTIDGFLEILEHHFSQQVIELEGKIKKDLEVMRIDYTTMILQFVKKAQKYHIRLPNEIIIFIRAISIVGFMAKEMDYNVDVSDIVLRFFKRYPEHVIAQYDTNSMIFKRMNREEAIDKLNNWLTYLLEVDSKLYQTVNAYISKIYA